GRVRDGPRGCREPGLSRGERDACPRKRAPCRQSAAARRRRVEDGVREAGLGGAMIRHKESVSRRGLLKAALRMGLASLAAPLAGAVSGQPAAESWGFATKGIEGWARGGGRWGGGDMAGAGGGRRGAVQARG